MDFRPPANPYQSPGIREPSHRDSTTAPPRQGLRWRASLALLCLVWAALPLQMISGTVWLRPVFEDFAVSLPSLTSAVLQWPLQFGAAAVAITAMLVAHLRREHWLWRTLLLLGLVLNAVALVALLGPLISLWTTLS